MKVPAEHTRNLGDVMRRVVLAAVMCFLSSTDGLSQPASDDQQIRAVRAQFNAAIARHDVPTILSFLEKGFWLRLRPAGSSTAGRALAVQPNVGLSLEARKR